MSHSRDRSVQTRDLSLYLGSVVKKAAKPNEQVAQSCGHLGEILCGLLGLPPARGEFFVAKGPPPYLDLSDLRADVEQR